MPRSPRSLLLATAVAAALVPAAAHAQSGPSGLTLSAKPDPAAAENRTPKIAFTLSNTVKRRAYSVELHQTSGQQAITDDGYSLFCQPTIGLLDDVVAPGRKLALPPIPKGTYTLPGYQPCTGMYDGKLTTPGRRGAPDRILQTFRFRVPEMTITSVHLRGKG
jgi:hypothetical protein